MERLMTNHRAYFPHMLFILGLAIFVFASAAFLQTRSARADSDPCELLGQGWVSLAGHAWAGFLVPGSPPYASGPGWISFSGVDSNGISYAVCENTITGALAGNAWSSAFGQSNGPNQAKGWINFDGLTADATHPAPHINLSTGQVFGWVRACAAFANSNSCSGPLNTGTGSPGNEWDGWISLSGKAQDNSVDPSCPDGTSSYCVVQNPPNCSNGWSGHAWGSADIGWVDMAGVSCAPQNPIVASCTVSPAVGNTSTPFVWSVSPPTGGSGAPYTYAWTFDGVSSANTTSSVTKTYSGTGAHTGTVRVSDSLGNSLGFTCYAVDSSGNQLNPPQSGIIVYPAPTATLTASKYTITNGQSTTLTWSSTNATSGCTGSGFNTGGATSGSVSVSPSVTTNYGVTCSNPGGSSSDSKTITVKKPTITIGANPTRVSTGTHTKIFWTSTDTNSCTVTGNGISASGTTSPNNGDPTSGIDSGAITQQTVFTINCTTDGSPASSQVIINILPIFQEF